MLFKSVGYYICGITDADDWLNSKGISGKMLTVTGDMGDNHPLLDGYFWKSSLMSKREYENRKVWYRSKLKLSEQLFHELYEETAELFDSRIGIDGRFAYLSDARHFYEKYFSAVNCRIVSVSTSEQFYETLKCEMQESSNCEIMDDGTDDFSLLGYDILGWYHSGFYSFWQNSLQEYLSGVRFNDLCLLENTFDEVAGFADKIQGKGEPVIWTPCKIGDCGK